MTVKPGYGLHNIHLRQSIAEVAEQFGKPERRQKADAMRTYWLWPRFGFECLVSAKTDRILSIFFHQNFVSPALQEMGWPEDLITQTLDHPAKTGGDFELSNGHHVDRWMIFDSGIGFHLDDAGKITTISVSRPKAKTKASAVVSHRMATPQSLAALRR